MHATQPIESARRRRRSLLWLAPVLAFIALACWAVASPVGASPDDEFHLTSIWCASGETAGVCEDVADTAARAVAEPLAEAGECFKFDSNQSAACAANLDSDRLVESTRGNFVGSYPPIYYTAMGWFSGDGFSAATVVLLRILNVVLFLGIAVALHLLLPARLRSASLWTWLIGLVPLGVFLLASNNPSAWAVISGGTVWIATLGYFIATTWRRWVLLALALVTTLMGAGARADAAAFAAIGILVAAVLAAERTRRYLLSILPFVAAVLLAGILFVTSRQAGVLLSGLTGRSEASTLPTGDLIFGNLLEVPSLWAGAFGTWPLGWLDTALPASVWVPALSVFAAMCFAGLRSMSKRKAVAIAIVLVALVGVPTWVLLRSGVLVGDEVQPRYILPLVIMLGGVAMLQLHGRSIGITTTQLWVIGIALSTANAVALHTNLRRYISGLDVIDWNLGHHLEWWWPGFVAPMIVWAVGSFAFAGAAALVLRELRTRPVVIA